jgi:hypothetical protein
MVGLPSIADPERRRSMEQRMAAFYPEVRDVEGLLGLIVSRTTGFASFVEGNRELYRFLCKEGVMDTKWELPRGEWSEPFAESLGRSLAAIVAAGGVEDATARTWGYAFVGMIEGAIEWWAVAPDRDRLEVEHDVIRLAAAALRGILAEKRRAAKRAPGAEVRRRKPARPR